MGKLDEMFKSSVGDDSGSVDGTTSALADEVAASPESMRVFTASVMSGFIAALHEGGVQGEQLKKIVTDPEFQSGVAKLAERFKSSVGDDSGSVDGTTSALADKVAASPESMREVTASVMSGFIAALHEGAVQGEQLKKIVTDPEFQSGVAKLAERFKSSMGDDSGSVDGTTSALADKVAASPK
ncbi:hypothetical protein ES288_D01G011400v1 [Gossypium darwinii]|uniref:Uncharacterized protein n=1 Tax=Gossypium darwinii TaxID=34276 RepID=A0A5D2DIW9_GOSDA|nr:hypothetical protein ES288_D01G011400v1 [Gossypium darwinii]